MFEEIKKVITESAIEAVELAENAYNSGEGQLKKQAALNYVAASIKLPQYLEFLKPLLLKLLEEIMDEAVEAAVVALKKKLEKAEG